MKLHEYLTETGWTESISHPLLWSHPRTSGLRLPASQALHTQWRWLAEDEDAEDVASRVAAMVASVRDRKAAGER